MSALRVARAQDAEAVCAIYAPIVETTSISFELTASSAPKMAQRIINAMQMYPWLVEETADGAIAGYAYASRHRARGVYGWSVDVTVYVAETSRRRGVGGRIYTALLDTLRVQGFRAAFAGIALPNAASVALHETLGGAPVGIYRAVGHKLGDWRDVGWWRRALYDDDAPPHPAIPFRDLDASLLAPMGSP